jgi:CheY-like chemotaxis protein
VGTYGKLLAIQINCATFIPETNEIMSLEDNFNTDKAGEEGNKLPLPEEPVKVLLADDDKDDQEIFQEALDETQIPTELTTVDNGKELIDNLKDPEIPNPDIVFMDINMPVKDGKQVLAEIRNDENLKDIPTVILSTSKNEKDVEEAFNAGANLYVPKPYSFRNFILMLKKVFSLKWTGELLKPLRKTFFMSEKNLH